MTRSWGFRVRSAGAVLGLGMCTAAAVMPSPPAAAAVPPTVSVDGAVQVTPSPADARAHLVPAIAVDPRNDQILAIAEADVLSGQCAVHVSTNAGLSWNVSAAPMVPAEWPSCTFVPFGPVVDVTFGPDGTLYYAFSGYNPATKHGRVFLARSTDLGASWDTSMLPWVAPNLDQGEAGIDAVPSVAVDPHNGKLVYVGWGSNWATYTLTSAALQGKKYYTDVVERAYVAASADGGKTFSDPVNVGAGLRLAPSLEGVKPPPQVVVGNQGQVYAVFGEYSRPLTADSKIAPPAHIYLATSRNQGKTYTNAAIYTEPTPTKSSDWTWVPRTAIDRGNGNLYVAWEHMSAAANPVQISLIRSTDGGRTWGRETKVNDVTPLRQWNYPELYPSISVAPSGRVDVAWYDYRNDPTYVTGAKDNSFQDVYYSYSTDGGQNWAPNIKLNDRAIDRRIGVSNQGGIRGPVGVASLNGVAFVAWDDTRNAGALGQRQDIYFARARLEKPSALFSTTNGSNRSVAWGVGGVAVGLALAGVVLLLVLPRLRRTTVRTA